MMCSKQRHILEEALELVAILSAFREVNPDLDTTKLARENNTDSVFSPDIRERNVRGTVGLFDDHRVLPTTPHLSVIALGNHAHLLSDDPVLVTVVSARVSPHDGRHDHNKCVWWFEHVLVNLNSASSCRNRAKSNRYFNRQSGVLDTTAHGLHDTIQDALHSIRVSLGQGLDYHIGKPNQDGVQSDKPGRGVIGHNHHLL